jgi:hypothetical protein
MGGLFSFWVPGKVSCHPHLRGERDAFLANSLLLDGFATQNRCPLFLQTPGFFEWTGLLHEKWKPLFLQTLCGFPIHFRHGGGHVEIGVACVGVVLHLVRARLAQHIRRMGDEEFGGGGTRFNGVRGWLLAKIIA